MAIAYRPDGTVAGTRKTVSGEAVAVEESERTGALGRADWLRARVREAAPKPR
jgi:hypothetical protein